MTLCDPPRFCFNNGFRCEVCSTAAEVAAHNQRHAATHHAAMVRLVVSQQWVATVIARGAVHPDNLDDDGGLTEETWSESDPEDQRQAAEYFPCAVDVVGAL
jgi:hypothetical protein